MMLVRDTKEYDPEYPETFPWGRVDSIGLCKLGTMIAEQIALDLTAEYRVYTPGLRGALRLMASIATVDM